MRWFLLPSEAHAALRGDQYQPMFYPRSDNALHDHNRLNRKRLKSGLSSVKFCNCSKQKHRHLKNKDCSPRSGTDNKKDENFNIQDEIDKELAAMNKENNVNSTQVRIYQSNGNIPKNKDILHQSNGTVPKTNGHANGYANGHVLNAKEINTCGDSLPGQVWDLDIALS